MPVTPDHASQYRDEGYFVLEGVVPETTLTELRAECDRRLDAQLRDMEMVATDTLGLSHRERRHFLAAPSGEGRLMQEFLLGDLMAEVVGAVLGGDAYLFLELFVTKAPRVGLEFGWHQDSGYLMGLPHQPYVTVWCALDDATEESGALWVLPAARAVEPHVKDPATGDLVGYHGDDPGIALPVPAGSMIVMSSTTFHRSGVNVSGRPRRAFLASYSPEPIRRPDGELWNRAVPFLPRGAT